MSTQILKGDELQIFVLGHAPFWATSHTLTITGNTVDVATKDHGFWGSQEVGNITWELTAECLYSTSDYDAFFNAMISRTLLSVQFAQVANYDANGLESVGGNVDAWQANPYHSKRGYAYITSITANANTGENASYSITFTGAGPLMPVMPISDYISTIMDFNTGNTRLFKVHDSSKNLEIYDERTGETIPITLSNGVYEYDGEDDMTTVPVRIKMDGTYITEMYTNITSFLLFNMETVPDTTWLDLRVTPVEIIFDERVKVISDSAFELPSDGDVDKVFRFLPTIPPVWQQSALGNVSTIRYLVCPIGCLEAYEDVYGRYGTGIIIYENGDEPY